MAQVPQDTETLYSKSELFKDLSIEDVREIIRLSKERSFEAGDVVFEQSSDASGMFLIQSGEMEVRAVTLTGEDVVYAIFGPGNVVGEMGLLEGGERSATVKALSACTAYQLTREAFAQLRSQHQRIASRMTLNLARMLGERRRQTDARVAEVFLDPDHFISTFATQVHELIGRLRKA